MKKKINREKVIEMLLKGYKQKDVAKKLGISQSIVSIINKSYKTGKTYIHMPIPKENKLDVYIPKESEFEDYIHREIDDKLDAILEANKMALLIGETGTGKELLAKYIHEHSLRAKGPMLAINCGAFNEELLANELFGHEKGAFTGASYMKKGLIEMASQGTLFLDEITEMSLSMQTKLLRVIQEKEILRLGGTNPIKVDVRFIAATNQDIQDAVKSGQFRQDLFYRLNVISLHIPPLCERKGDVPLLSYYFLKKYAIAMNKEVKEISPKVIEILTNYDFPGNVRELENIIERGVALASGDTLEPEHLPEDLRRLEIHTFRKKGNRYPTLEEQEKSYIQWILKEVGGNKSLAANILGIDRVSLWRKLKRYNLD